MQTHIILNQRSLPSSSRAIIMLALVDNRPKVLSQGHGHYYLEHQREIITRRTHELKKQRIGSIF